jgi:methylated-DNA-[protein]-cysteine S-methyltransferase
MPAARRFALFPTALGDCAIAWHEVGLPGVWLPEAGPAALRRRMAQGGEASEAPAADAPVGVVAAITRLLAGEPVDLGRVPLDESGIDDFDRRVYAVARAIPAGIVLTYGEVAARVGPDASPRAVGQSLGRNRMPIVVPCHRVVASGVGLGGFSAPGGTATKRRLLAIEKARRDGPPDLFDVAPSRGPVQAASPAPGTVTTASSTAGALIEPSGRS